MRTFFKKKKKNWVDFRFEFLPHTHKCILSTFCIIITKSKQSITDYITPLRVFVLTGAEISSYTILKSASLSSVCKHLKSLFETNVCTCCPLHATQPKISTSTKGVKSPDNAVLNKKEKPLSRVQIYTKHIFFTTFRSDKQQGTAFYWIPSLNRLNPPRWQRFTELSSTFN